MARKLSDLSLEELYLKEKITPSVEKLIKERDNFQSLNTRYCERVCKYKNKCVTPSQKVMPDNSSRKGYTKEEGEVKLVIVQDHWSAPNGYGASGSIMDSKVWKIIQHAMKEIDAKFAAEGDYALVSALKCIPSDKEEKVKDGDIKKCSPYLLSELNRLNPKAILCLGTSSSKILGCNKSVYTNRGEIVNSPFGPVVHTLHPKSLMMLRQNASGQMWGPDYYSCFKLDLEKAMRIAKGIVTPIFDLRGSVTRYLNNYIEICDTNEKVEQAVKRILELPPHKIVSFDTETTSLDPFAEDAKLLCIQFGWKDLETNDVKAVVIPLWHRENTTVDPERAWNEATKILLSDRRKLAHNGKFDIKYIYTTKGVRVVNAIYDTMLLLHEINSGIQGNYSLKKAAWDYLYETGIAGYEDLLPSLTTKEKATENDDGNTTDEAEQET